MTITRKQLERFVTLTKEAQYDYINKEEYRKLGRRILKRVVELMGLNKGEYDIRWNPGGQACSGDHTLHANWFYLALHDNIGSGWFYFRTCKGRKDYTGGHNQIVNWSWLIVHGLEELVVRIAEGCPEPELTMLAKSV